MALDVLALVARAVLAGVLCAAAAGKALDRHGTRRAAGAVGLGPRPASAVAIGLPAVEVVVAGALVLVPRVGAFAAAALLVVFTATLLQVGRTPTPTAEAPDERTAPRASCGCFGAVGSALAARPAATTSARSNGTLVGLVRNASLVALCPLAASGPHGPSAAVAAASVTTLVAGALVAVTAGRPGRQHHGTTDDRSAPADPPNGRRPVVTFFLVLRDRDQESERVVRHLRGALVGDEPIMTVVLGSRAGRAWPDLPLPEADGPVHASLDAAPALVVVGPDGASIRTQVGVARVLEAVAALAARTPGAQVVP